MILYVFYKINNINYIEVYMSMRDNIEWISSKDEDGKSRCSSVSRLAVQQMLGKSIITLPNREESFALQCFCNNSKNCSCSISMCGEDSLSVGSAEKHNFFLMFMKVKK